MAQVASANITDDEVRRLRLRVGYTATSQLTGHVPFNTTASADSFRHFAEGYGDDNPLYGDRAYGEAGPYGGPVAPPGYLGTIGRPTGPKPPPEVVEASASALAGAQAFQSGGEWRFFRPVREGDRLATANVITDVEDKQSEFGGGRSVIIHHEQVWWNEDDVADVLAVYHTWYVNTDRASSSKAGKNRAVAEPHYTDEDLAAIDAAYGAATRRGAEPRWWDDVAVGDALPPIVKGPLTVTDMISFHMGWGWSGQGTFALGLARRHRLARPRLWQKNRFGAYDTVQRVHWDDDFAYRVGAPRAYDYGFMRSCWVMHALTDWMGDLGCLHRYDDRTRRFNYVGDTTWVHGTVVAKDERGAAGSVTIDLTGTNQDGATTVTATAEVLLPRAGVAAVPRPVVTDEAHELVRRSAPG